MKLNLRPGISPAMFWSTVGLGAAGTAASALTMTAYTWAPAVAGLLTVIITWWQASGPKAPPPPPAPPVQPTP